MKDEESKYYPRLQLISEFNGEVEGRLKFHKSLFMYRNEVMDKTDWPFTSEERGPMDRGASSIMDSYEQMGLVRIDDEGDVYLYEETKKGSRFIRGIKRGLAKLQDSEVDQRDDAMKKVAERNKDRSGYEIVQDEEVQGAKENPYQTDV